MKFISATLGLLILIIAVNAQDTDRKIQFPDVEGYRTLKCDFHIHTVFSDDYVWPTIRIDEAVKDGLDAISLTEHIEYQPWSDDIPHLDRNRSFELAKEAAKPYDLIVTHGTEITRDMPPGHANAIFVKDVNKIIVDDPLEAYEEAGRQGAFVFWDHPHWIQQELDGIPQFSDFHKFLLKENLLHGVEVVNDITFSEEALELAIESGITVMGTSDIHGLIDWQFNLANGGHRPICLVLAKEKSAESIQEALFAGRTITWFDNLLAGKPENMNLLLAACLGAESKGMIGPTSVLEVDITNASDARFLLKNDTDYDFHRNADVVEILPHSTKRIQVLADKVEASTVHLKFRVLNAVVGYKENAVVEFSF